MVSLESFYRHARLVLDPRTQSSVRIREQLGRIVGLFEGVVEGLPDEEQFETTCNIYIMNEDLMQIFLKNASKRLPIRNLNTSSPEAEIIFLYEDLEDIQYAITLVADNLDVKPDDYIVRLIAYRFSEWSHFRRGVTNILNQDNLGAEKCKELVDRLHSSRFLLGDREREEYERSIDAEVRRLGFQSELIAYDIP